MNFIRTLAVALAAVFAFSTASFANDTSAWYYDYTVTEHDGNTHGHSGLSRALFSKSSVQSAGYQLYTAHATLDLSYLDESSDDYSNVLRYGYVDTDSKGLSASVGRIPTPFGSANAWQERAIGSALSVQQGITAEGVNGIRLTQQNALAQVSLSATESEFHSGLKDVTFSGRLLSAGLPTFDVAASALGLEGDYALSVSANDWNFANISTAFEGLYLRSNDVGQHGGSAFASMAMGDFVPAVRYDTWDHQHVSTYGASYGYSDACRLGVFYINPTEGDNKYVARLSWEL